MATKYECDRCGNQFRLEDDLASVEYPKILSFNQISEGKTSVDLCLTCLRLLEKFLARQPKAEGSTK